MAKSELPALPSVLEIQRRLEEIYPMGSPQRGYCVREIAAKTVFVMLYLGAVEGSGNWMRPDQVTRMSDNQAARSSSDERSAWAEESLAKRAGEIAGAWYATNTREPIRDETIRQGLVPTGAVIDRRGLATTSSKPRYALAATFARLFDPALDDEALASAIARWQDTNLSPRMLARLRLAAGAGSKDEIVVKFPNEETRRLPPGPSSIISKAVIEVFAPRFLAVPAVLWLSDSRNKVVARDDKLAQSIGIEIDAKKHLPDLILADVAEGQLLLVFVEVVATDGPVTEERREALLELARNAGLDHSDVAFVTAYSDRGDASFRKTIGSLAMGSAAWFMSEPESLIVKLGNEQTSGRSLRGLMST